MGSASTTPYHRLDDDEPPRERRKGLLSYVVVAALAYLLLFYPAVGNFLSSALTQICILAVGVPSLLGAVTLTFTYLATICVRPNTLGPIDWYTAAWLQGLVASVLALIGSPLTNELAAAYQAEPVWRVSVPTVELDLPIPHFEPECLRRSWPAIAPCLFEHMHASTERVLLGGAEVSIEYGWWLLGALLALVSTAVFVGHLALSTLLLGAFCCNNPALWRYTEPIDDDEAMAELRDWVRSP